MKQGREESQQECVHEWATMWDTRARTYWRDGVGWKQNLSTRGLGAWGIFLPTLCPSVVNGWTICWGYYTLPVPPAPQFFKPCSGEIPVQPTPDATGDHCQKPGRRRDTHKQCCQLRYLKSEVWALGPVPSPLWASESNSNKVRFGSLHCLQHCVSIPENQMVQPRTQGLEALPKTAYPTANHDP